MTEIKQAYDLLGILRNPDSIERLNAAQALGQVDISNQHIVQAIERVAVSDPDPMVRQAALEALSAPAHQRVQWQCFKQSLNPVPPSRMQREIDEWARSELIPAETATLLKQRYPLQEPSVPPQASPTTAPPPAPPVSPAPAQSPARQPTLSQILLSETSIKVALYMGAFFVVAAGFIIAALVEVARLPILSVVTLLLLGSSLALMRRLPMAGFVLYAAGGLMIPIDARVLEDLLHLTNTQAGSLWCVTYIFSALIWIAGTWRMRSRLFSLLAFIACTLAAYNLRLWLDSEHWCLLLGTSTLLGLAGAWLLRRWDGNKLFWPLFVIAQIQQAVLLLASIGRAFAMAIDSRSTQSLSWLDIAGLWLVSTLFYIASDLLIPPSKSNSGDTKSVEISIFQLLSVFCLAIVPLVAVQAFSPTLRVFGVVAWIWGGLFALAGEGLCLAGKKKLNSYGFYGLLASAPLLLLGILVEQSVGLRVFYWAGAATLYTGLAIRQIRWPIWSLAVVAWTAAYLTGFSLPAIESLGLFIGFILIVPMAVYLMFDLFGRKHFSLSRHWTLPVLIMGILLVVVTGYVTIISFMREPGNVALTYLMMAAFLTIYAVLDSQVVFWAAALVTAYVGYLAMLQLDGVARLELFPGFLYLPPAIAYLLIYRIIRYQSVLKPAWWQSSLSIGGMAGAIDITLALTTRWQPGNVALTCLLWAVVLGVFTLIETERVLWWSGTLVMLYAGYLAGSSIDAVVSRGIFSGYIHLIPAVVFLSIDLAARRLLNAGTGWTTPPRALGAIAGLVTSGFAISSLVDAPERGAIVFTIFAVYFTVYAVLDSRQWVTYLATGAGALAYFFFLMSVDRPDPRWAMPFTFFATGYYLLGLVLTLSPLGRNFALSRPLQLSGIFLGSLVSLIAFFQGGLAGVFGIALVATCLAIEALRQRNVWLGYPTNFFYLLSYFLILRELKVDEPQFFAIGAAMLGLFMHYLLVRNQSKGAAFITGLLSQLILQSTSYIQMVATQDLKFFMLLFFESIVVMIYGLVIRSRSLLFVPIAFLILGTGTVAFTILKGVSTAAIIGSTGVVLLMLGILALLMRERLTRWAEVLNTWQP
ncbi:MAG: HEAT repeat domain-containing protein [Anaerolineae bacterium]|nr:HEAT repeat domain-containing protein [Anaerolineae bacterium]